MANYLKLKKSYIGNDILKNPEFNMLGPEKALNSDFSQYYDSTVAGVEGVLFNDWDVDSADLGGSSYKLEAIPNGYKQTLITLPTVSSDVYKTRVTQDLSSVLEVGKVYKVNYEIKGSSNYLLYNSVAKKSSQDVLTPTPFIRAGDNQETIKVEHEFAVTELLDTGNNPVTVGQYISFYMTTDAEVGDWIEVTNFTLKETGQIDYSPDPLFSSSNYVTSVSALLGWSNYGSPTSNNVIAASSKSSLEIVATGGGQGAQLDISSIPNGMEVNFKVEEITGDLGARGIFIEGDEDIDTSSGSVNYTFVKQSNNSAIFFRAGDNTAGTTNYYNITVRPTNVFAYGYVRVPLTNNSSGNNTVFSANNVTFTANGISSLYDVVKFDESNPTIDGSEYILTVNVLSVDEAPFVYWNGTAYITEYLSVGENKINFTKLSGVSGFYFGIQAQNSSQVGSTIVIDSMELQEAKNQPKLIGVDNVSTVSAPTNSTVVINNGLTDGADTITITYAEADASSTVQMRNFFQDAIVESANANNTGKVIEIKSPVLINDIVAS
jgi:hypothetical protein